MYKQFTFLIITATSFFFSVSCGQRGHNENSKVGMQKLNNYKAGDCFEFKTTIKDFGLVLLEENIYEDGTQFNLFPVKLDTTKIGIERFTNGHAYISRFPDLTKSNGYTEGFMVYSFLNEAKLERINALFQYVGSVKISSQYQNMTGSTMAEAIDHFRFQLDMWDKMFGENAKLIIVSQLSQ
jgi:hypothetical protein